jgi:hypothetical protein
LFAGLKKLSQVLSEQASDSSAFINAMWLLKHVDSIFHILIRIICNLINEGLLNQEDEMKEDETQGACCTNGRDEKCLQKTEWMDDTHLGDLDVDGRIILTGS